MTFWAILILLVLVAGLVAYVGDLVAKRVGKRHWRFLGLRPRATATLVAVATGVLIALGAFGAFFLLVREARETILRAEAVRQERDRLRAEVGRLESRAATIFSQYEQLKAERDEFERSLTLLARQLSQNVELQRQTRQDLEEVLVERERLRQELERLQAEGQAQRVALEELKQARADLLQERERLEREKTLLQTENSRLLSDRETLRVQAQRAEQQLRRFEQARQEAQKRLGELRRRTQVLEARLRQLEQEKRNLEGDIAVLGRASVAPALDEGLGRQLESLQRENADLWARLLEAQRELQQVKERNRVIAAGLERALRMSLLAEEVVLPGREQMALLEVVRRAENRVRLLGLRGMEVAELPELLNLGSGLLLARVRGVDPEGRVQVVIEYRAREQVFAEGEVLASTTLLLPASSGELRRKFNALTQVVESRLSGAGWIPEKLAQGGIPLEEFASLAAQLSGRRGGTRVGVVALKDLYPTEPPRLGLRILP
ncbi:Chromosome partition protein Smc [Meiothermus luteus]|jgi:uncharacterized protein (DUF3084 family)|uniref:Chromosome partition protein Smc n=1 Tax=Meiothermus luteus TaxID=2026184 RepID=A0A399F0F2_9DEIN|nr:DUF3084 domain-containing protein [Meiothermus luteus]RIH89758.1 Chromosome partition protein Smc [Meiothermus luteus]RMH57795.1 MAG: DUF3084 domain-containing protein [Deinococcota bacterium]